MAVVFPAGKRRSIREAESSGDIIWGSRSSSALCTTRCGARDCEGGDAAHASPLLRHAPSGVGHDIRTVQELMGHANVKTTMIYTTFWFGASGCEAHWTHSARRRLFRRRGVTDKAP